MHDEANTKYSIFLSFLVQKFENGAGEPKDLTFCFNEKHLWVVLMKAYVFLYTQLEAHWKVAEASLKISGVKTAHAVTGPCDVLVHVVFEDMETLGELLRKIHTIDGVKRTRTAIVIPAKLH
jgi:DNA-binding Lrp family transcriptional regulator